MKTRIGGAPSRTGRKHNAPNKRIVKSAQLRLSNIVDRANQMHENALSVDGNELFIFRRERAGHLCTCFGNNQTGSSLIITGDDEGEEDQYVQTEINEDGEAEVVSMVDFEDSDDEFSITTLRNDRRAKEGLDYQALLEDVRFASDDTDRYFDIDEIENIPANGVGDSIDDPVNSAGDEDDEFAQIDASADQRARLTRTLESLLTGGEQTPCGICFSTGWTEGYQLINGRRINLTTHDVYSHGGFGVDKDQFPFVFEGSLTSDPVEWRVDLPKYFNNVIRAAVWDNFNIAASLRLYVKYNGSSEFVPLTAKSLNARKGMDNTGTIIQAFPHTGDGASDVSVLRFTHIEIILETGPRIVGQMPQIEIAETFDTFEAIIQTNIELPARISALNVGSAIIDRKHHRCWRVVAITINKTSSGQIFSIEAQVQMIPQKEPLDRLNVFRNYTVVNSNYKGLEEVQGSRQTGNQSGDL